MVSTEQIQQQGLTALDRVFSWGLFIFWLSFWFCVWFAVKG